MNILFISSCRGWGGGETWLAEISSALQQRGNRVTIVCRTGSEIHRRLRSSPCTLIPVRMWGDFDPVAIFRLYRIIKRQEIDLVCTNMEKDLRLGGIAALLAKIPIIPSREVDIPIKDTRVNRFYYRRVASGMMVNSHATLRTVHRGIPWLGQDRIEVVWKGVDPRRYASVGGADLRKEFHLSTPDCIAGFIGRLDEQKGIPTLLEAMKDVALQGSRIRLILAGEGNLRGEIESFRRTHRLEGHLFLAGFRDDIPSFLKEIDFLVMPSYWEGFGYAAVEAMASGKAVVATRTSSLPEIIDDQTTGLLVAPHSARELAGAMLKLEADPDLRHKMGCAGALKVRSHFTLSAMVDKTEAFFWKSVQSHRAGRQAGGPSLPGREPGAQKG